MISKFLKLLLACVTITICVCCSNEETLLEPTTPSNAVSANPYKVTLSDALKHGESVVNSQNNNAIRSSKRIQSVEYITTLSGKTRGAATTDTLLYVVNYENNQGFILLGADLRVRPVYGFSTEGNISLSDTTSNKALSAIYNKIILDANLCIRYNSNQTRGLGIGDIIPPNLGDREITVFYDIKPHIGYWPSRWGQKSNFNAYCPFYNGTSMRCPVGCTPLATVIIMSYYKWPSKFLSFSIDWDMVNSFDYTKVGTVYPCPDSLAKLLNEVGIYFHATYGINGAYQTGCSAEAPLQLISGLGYNYDKTYKSLFGGSLGKDVTQGPLLVNASANSGKMGHTFVVDGYFSYSEKWIAIDNERHERFYSYAHCIWGWNGDNNGYFWTGDDQITAWNLDYFGENDTEKYWDVPDGEDFEDYEYIDLKYLGPFTPNPK